ncbi:unnamed protein product [Echinostoma caproni]|uniref:DHC_N1 domain-containing protein n=1 Tax=Echinostoma caproni TaxID=27848 RepID=A0A183A1C7_9TREM|nr:unnamed protein product [Echinostoma caproni]
MDDQGKADALASYFGSIHRIDDDMPRILKLRSSPPEVEEIWLSVEVVRQHLEGLDIHKAARPDEIHTAIIKPIADILAGPT